MEVFKIVSLGAVLSLIVGCQSLPYQPYARNVKMKPKNGGVIALKTVHRPEDRVVAKDLMRTTCGKKEFEILEEGEVIVGTITNASSREYEGNGEQNLGKIFGLNVVSNDPNRTNQRSETSQKKEWQIKYKCLRVAKAKSKSRVR